MKACEHCELSNSTSCRNFAWKMQNDTYDSATNSYIYSMLKYLLVVSILVCCNETFCQKKFLYGTVSDSSNSEKLFFVNVYINNSTIGTATDEKGNYSIIIPEGKHEIVFSLVGYRSQTIRASSTADTIRMNIVLAPVSEKLASVTIEGSEDVEWRRLIGEFKSVFLGETKLAKYCEIVNPEYIDLRTDKIDGRRVLFAACSRSIEVKNEALGYKVLYDLHDFSSSSAWDRFKGSIYFIPLKAEDSRQDKFWRQNRLKAYKGSVCHLFKSILDHQLKEQGFALFVNEKGTNEVKGVFDIKTEDISPGSIAETFRIRVPGEIQVHYNEYQGIDLQNSIITFPRKYVDVDKLGVVLDPADIIVSGDLASSRVSNLLPFDFRPASDN
jgi:hypothetical protein